MMNLMIKGLPDTVIIGGEPFWIKTDYRVWMRFCQDFEGWDRKVDIDISYIFTGAVPCIGTIEDMNAVLAFAYPPAVVPKDTGGGFSGKILDYEVDADYIYAAFLGQYGIDLLETDLHWHKFRALLSGLNDSTRLHEIMGYRCYTGNDKDLIRLRNAWEIPVELSEELSEEEQVQKQEFEDYFG